MQFIVPAEKKRFRAPNLAAILGKCNFFCGGNSPKMYKMNTERQWHVGSHRWSTNRLLNVSKVKYEASHNHSGYKYQLTQMDPRDALPASRASCCAQRWTLSVINWPRPSVERRPLLSNEADHTLPRSKCRGEIHMWMCGCCIPLYVCLSPLQIAHSRERHIGRIVTMRMRQWMHRICRRGGSVRCKCGGPSMDRKKISKKYWHQPCTILDFADLHRRSAILTLLSFKKCVLTVFIITVFNLEIVRCMHSDHIFLLLSILLSTDISQMQFIATPFYCDVSVRFWSFCFSKITSRLLFGLGRQRNGEQWCRKKYRRSWKMIFTMP